MVRLPKHKKKQADNLSLNNYKLYTYPEPSSFGIEKQRGNKTWHILR